MKLAASQSDHNIVQIFTEDRHELTATIPAIPAYRLNPTDDTLITIEERPTGSPEAVKRWFCPGDLAGVAFVYPEDQRWRRLQGSEAPAAALPPCMR